MLKVEIMGHSHNHSHHHDHAFTPEAASGALVIGIVINVLYAAVECGVGLWQNSMGLIADAGHNLSDVAGLVLALVAVKLVKKRANDRYTFGYRKASVLISLVNAVILFVAVGAIVWESVEKFFHPAQIAGWTVSVTAAVGVAVNFVSARLLMPGKDKDLNVKGAYLHMMLDALVSVGVVVSGIIISFTGWNVVDPVVGLVVGGVIIFSSWHLLKASLRLAVDGVPEDVDMEDLVADMKALDGVHDVHHLHVWALSTTQTALTVHVVVGDIAESEAVRDRVRRMLHEHGISHTTIEIETHRNDGCECC